MRVREQVRGGEEEGGGGRGRGKGGVPLFDRACGSIDIHSGTGIQSDGVCDVVVFNLVGLGFRIRVRVIRVSGFGFRVRVNV